MAVVEYWSGTDLGVDNDKYGGLAIFNRGKPTHAVAVHLCTFAVEDGGVPRYCPPLVTPLPLTFEKLSRNSEDKIMIMAECKRRSRSEVKRMSKCTASRLRTSV